MKRLAVLAVLLVASCNDRPPVERPCAGGLPCTPSPSPSPSPSPAPAPTTPIDCGFIDATIRGPAAGEPQAEQCFADGFRAGRSTTLKLTSVTDEGGKIYTTFRAIPGAGGSEVEMTIDDRDDGFSGAPGIHVQRCTAPRIERQPDGHEAVVPDGCH